MGLVVFKMKACKYIVKVTKFQLSTAYCVSTAKGKLSLWVDSAHLGLFTVNPISRITYISWIDQLSDTMRYLRDFPRVCMGSIKDNTGISKGSNCNQITILKGRDLIKIWIQ